jgi:predicted nucleic acid-binding protein
MYLVDTDVISEIRKRDKANPGVTKFFRQAAKEETALYLSAVTIGELRRGVELILLRGDAAQAQLLDAWLHVILRDYQDNILPLDADAAQVWGSSRVPHPENALDKQIAATALIHDLTLVTRNEKHFAGTGAKLFNPFQQG